MYMYVWTHAYVCIHISCIRKAPHLKSACCKHLSLSLEVFVYSAHISICLRLSRHRGLVLSVFFDVPRSLVGGSISFVRSLVVAWPHFEHFRSILITLAIISQSIGPLLPLGLYFVDPCFAPGLCFLGKLTYCQFLKHWGLFRGPLAPCCPSDCICENIRMPWTVEQYNKSKRVSLALLVIRRFKHGHCKVLCTNVPHRSREAITQTYFFCRPLGPTRAG